MPEEYEKAYMHSHESCPALGFQDVLVGVPVEIKPFAKIGKVKTECIGKPIISRGKSVCEGKPREVCRFTINQKIRVEVPVLFGAKTDVGEARIDCKYHGHLCEHQEDDFSEHHEKEKEEHICRGLIG